jgi:hypothetical protein
MDVDRDPNASRGGLAALDRQPGVGFGEVVQRGDPAGQVRHRPGSCCPRDRRAEPDARMRAGQTLPEPRSTPPNAYLDLHGRLEAIDVGAIQESDLDESHGREDSVPRSGTLPLAGSGALGR